MVDKRLLVIDDEPGFGAFVRQVAEGEGFAVCVTTRADEFKEALATFAPTLVLLDVVMPDVEGFELLQYLADANWVGPVVVISGYNPDYLRLAKALGGSRGLPSVTTLAKPIHARELRAALAAAVQGSGAS
jgi:DNA-binding response OmpR family regulator